VRKFESLDAAVVTAMQRMVETTNDSLESIAQRLDVSVSTVRRYKT
jgi:transposase